MAFAAGLPLPRPLSLRGEGSSGRPFWGTALGGWWRSLASGAASPPALSLRGEGSSGRPFWGTALGGWWRSLPGYLSPGPLPAGRGEQRPAVLGDRVGRVVAFAAGLPLPRPLSLRGEGSSGRPFWGTALGGWWRSLPGYLSPGPSPCGERGEAAGRFGGLRWEGGGIRWRGCLTPGPSPCGERGAAAGRFGGLRCEGGGVRWRCGYLTPGPSPRGERGEISSAGVGEPRLLQALHCGGRESWWDSLDTSPGRRRSSGWQGASTPHAPFGHRAHQRYPWVGEAPAAFCG